MACVGRVTLTQCLAGKVQLSHYDREAFSCRQKRTAGVGGVLIGCFLLIALIFSRKHTLWRTGCLWFEGLSALNARVEVQTMVEMIG